MVETKCLELYDEGSNRAMRFEALSNFTDFLYLLEVVCFPMYCHIYHYNTILLNEVLLYLVLHSSCIFYHNG